MTEIEKNLVTQVLDQKEIPYRLFRHPGQVNSLEQAARERGQRPEQIIRSILFRLPDHIFIMVLIAGPGQISWNHLRSYLKTSRITTASADEVLSRTGYPIGAVSPIGIPDPLRILIDNNILKLEEISIGSGIRNTTVIMQVKDLLKVIDHYETGNFSERITNE